MSGSSGLHGMRAPRIALHTLRLASNAASWKTGARIAPGSAPIIQRITPGRLTRKPCCYRLWSTFATGIETYQELA
jgi:hypothetical protein